LREGAQMSRWCMGLPFTETRPITSDEFNRYTAELKRHQRKLKRQGWLLGLSAVAAALVSLEYVNQERGIPGNDASILFFSAIALALGVSGVAGSFGEVFFG